LQIVKPRKVVMSFNFIREFWFKAVVFTLALLVLTTWALSPVSQQDLIIKQEQNIEDINKSSEKLVSKNFENIQNEISYLISELNEKKPKDTLEKMDSSVKALFVLEQKDSQLVLMDDEFRSLDLSYWLNEDLSKSINRNYKGSDGLFYTGYQIISSPSGENYFGRLMLKDEKYYFAVLSLHFASSWSEDLNLAGNDIYVINSIGELVYHPEIQYIGTEYSQAEKIIENFDSEKNQLRLESRDYLSSVMMSSIQDIKVVVRQSKWVTPYGVSFYSRFLLVFLFLGLLLYTLSEYLLKKSKTKFINNELETSEINELKNFTSNDFLIEKKRLLSKIQRLENAVASQKEFVSPGEQEKLLHEVKSKSANLIGQIQLLQGQVSADALELANGAHNKATEIYKQIFSFINEKEDQSEVLNQASELSVYTKAPSRDLDYTNEDSIMFHEGDDRIEITEEDIGAEDLNIFGEIKGLSFLERIESKKNEIPKISDVNIDENISQQLSEQSYGKAKAFDIEEEFLATQKVEVIKLKEKGDIADQMSEIDKVIEKAERKVKNSKNELNKIIRKPRLEL